MGRYGAGIVNDNGEGLSDFCSVDGLVVTGTIFTHKDIYRQEFGKPDGPHMSR